MTRLTNEASVVLSVRKGSFGAILTGDAEGEVLSALVNDRTVGDVDVLKVGHHGSLGAVTANELAVMRPEIALISVGAGNRFGHPKPQTLAELGRAGSRVLRTDRCGDVTVRIDPDGTYQVRISRATEAGVRGSSIRRCTWSRIGTVCDTSSCWQAPDRARPCIFRRHMSKPLSEYKPVYLIYGDQDLLLERALDQLKRSVGELADLDFNSETFDGEGANADEVVAACNTLPFASERRLVVVRNVDKMSKDGSEILVKYAENPCETTVLALVAKKLAKNTRLYKAVDRLGGLLRARSAECRRVPRGGAETLRAQGQERDPSRCRAAWSTAVGKDLRRLSVEVDKAVAFTGAEGPSSTLRTSHRSFRRPRRRRSSTSGRRLATGTASERSRYSTDCSGTGSRFTACMRSRCGRCVTSSLPGH